MTLFDTTGDKDEITTILSVKLKQLTVRDVDDGGVKLEPVNGVKQADDICKTPTAGEHKIPNVVTCPPAPRKRKSASMSDLDVAEDLLRDSKRLTVSFDLESSLENDQNSSEKVQQSSE